jgi:hypothetical protein
VSYDAWERTVPTTITGDPLWKLRVYRAALYAGELGHRDADYLSRKQGCAEIAHELARSTGAISAHIAKGYSCVGRERLQYYEMALGASRESRDWYFKVRGVLGQGAGDSRLSLHTTIIKVLVALMTKARETGAGRRTPVPG